MGTRSGEDAADDKVGSIRPMKRAPHIGHCTFFPSAASGTFSLRLHCVHLRRIVMTTPNGCLSWCKRLRLNWGIRLRIVTGMEKVGSS
jgi:hypothetical protein